MGIPDFIDSTKLSARLLAMVSMSPRVSLIFNELVAEKGAGFSIKKISAYPGMSAVDGVVSFSQVMSAAVEFGEIAIAWWAENQDEGPWEVNPKDKKITRKYDPD